MVLSQNLWPEIQLAIFQFKGVISNAHKKSSETDEIDSADRNRPAPSNAENKPKTHRIALTITNIREGYDARKPSIAINMEVKMKSA